MPSFEIIKVLVLATMAFALSMLLTPAWTYFLYWNAFRIYAH